MTWVLILQPSNKGFPAVIGGYLSQDEAVSAGERACKTPAVRDMTPEQEQEWYKDKMGAYPLPWASYTVIPGAATMPPQPRDPQP